MHSLPRAIAEIASWHAHVYYDPDRTRDDAARLREWVSERFAVQMGRWHDARVGPHPVSMYQIAFMPDQFPTLLAFLALNRMGLTILVHPNTDNPHDDHLVHALWLGGPLEIDASSLPRSRQAAGHADSHAHEAVEANTTPSVPVA